MASSFDRKLIAIGRLSMLIPGEIHAPSAVFADRSGELA
jgi:hypothetical protein